jgi:hypothetical protein
LHCQSWSTLRSVGIVSSHKSGNSQSLGGSPSKVQQLV